MLNFRPSLSVARTSRRTERFSRCSTKTCVRTSTTSRSGLSKIICKTSFTHAVSPSKHFVKNASSIRRSLRSLTRSSWCFWSIVSVAVKSPTCFLRFSIRSIAHTSVVRQRASRFSSSVWMNMSRKQTASRALLHRIAHCPIRAMRRLPRTAPRAKKAMTMK